MQCAQPADIESGRAAPGFLHRRRQPRQPNLRRRRLRNIVVLRTPHVLGLEKEEVVSAVIRPADTQWSGDLAKVAVVGHADEARQKELPRQNPRAEQQQQTFLPFRLHLLPPRGNPWVGERSIEAAVRGSGGTCGRLTQRIAALPLSRRGRAAARPPAVRRRRDLPPALFSEKGFRSSRE